MYIYDKVGTGMEIKTEKERQCGAMVSLLDWDPGSNLNPAENHTGQPWDHHHLYNFTGLL